MSQGKIFVIGIGPGSLDLLTPNARGALASCRTVVGYAPYVKLIAPLVEDKELLVSGMRREVDRARAAFDKAREGRWVAVVSSGDSGVYGMAGLVYEVLAASGLSADIAPEIEVVPGIPALIAAAAILGAPLMNDFAAVSLSDLLTPWETIARRVDAAASADFVVALYNPQSKTRTQPLRDAVEILLRHRGPDCPVGIVWSAYRDNQRKVVATLDNLPIGEIDMNTLILVGNSQTRLVGDRMVTPRGYADKYELGGPEER